MRSFHDQADRPCIVKEQALGESNSETNSVKMEQTREGANIIEFGKKNC